VTTVHLADVVLPMVGEPIRDGAVVVDGDRVVELGRARGEYGDALVRRHRGVLTPGLVNAHAHLEYGPPFADLASSGLPFTQWIAELTKRRMAMTDQGWTESARGSTHELLRTGTTAVADIVTQGPAVGVATAVGLRGVSYVELAGVDDARWDAGRARLERLLGLKGRERGISPHTLYTLSNKVFREMVALARSRGMRLHPHLAETSDEAEWVMSGTGLLADFASRFGLEFELHGTGAGMTAVSHCAELGGLGPDVHVAHGVHVDATDRATLRAHQTVVALCPRSNAILQAGTAPVAGYLSDGNVIAVGTDSLASSPSLDLWADVRALRDIALSQGYAEPDLDLRLVEAATLGGAQALGDDELGRIRVGGRADFAVFDVPTDRDPFDSLVQHGAGACTATVLNGRLVHRGKVSP
jgi:cytosine/adenosine deaminase-related metal-dependent hydrolase